MFQLQLRYRQYTACALMRVTSMFSPSCEHHVCTLMCLKLLQINVLTATKEERVGVFAEPPSDTSASTCTLWPLTFQNVESWCHKYGSALMLLQHTGVNRGCVNEDNFCWIYSYVQVLKSFWINIWKKVNWKLCVTRLSDRSICENTYCTEKSCSIPQSYMF